MDDGELDDSACAENALTATGKKYQTKFYNLDMIISIGYRVNSKRGIDFKCVNEHAIRISVLSEYVKNIRE